MGFGKNQWGGSVVLRFGNCELDTDRNALRREGHAVEVQPRVLDLLIYLATAGHRVVSQVELHREVWKGVNVSETAVRKAIKQARRAVNDDGGHQRVIQTVRGKGFRFIVPVAEVPASQPGPADPFVGRRDILTALESELEAIHMVHL